MQKIRFSALAIRKDISDKEVDQEWCLTMTNWNNNEAALYEFLDVKAQHERYLESQRLLYKDSTASLMLRKAISRLQSLDGIDVAYGSHIIGARELRTSLRGNVHQMYNRNCQRAFKVLIRSLDSLVKPFRWFRFCHAEQHEAQYPGLDLGYPKAAYVPMTLAKSFARKEVCQNLESLDLNYFDARHPSGGGDFCEALSSFLGQSPCITSLRLGLRLGNNGNYPFTRVVELANTLHSARLSELRALALYLFDLAPMAYLRGFVFHHSDSLEVIVLDSCDGT